MDWGWQDRQKVMERKGLQVVLKHPEKPRISTWRRIVKNSLQALAWMLPMSQRVYVHRALLKDIPIPTTLCTSTVSKCFLGFVPKICLFSLIFITPFGYIC